MSIYRYKSIHDFCTVTVTEDIAIGAGEILRGRTLVIFKYSESGVSEVMEYSDFHNNFKEVRNE